MRPGRDQTHEPGSAVRLTSVARHVTDCATQPGMGLWSLMHITFCIQETPTFANSEDPDEMQHNAASHQGLHCLFFQSMFSKKIMKTVIFGGYSI